jgi:hypothetical protein
MKYYDIEANEWVRPIHKGYKLCCCDCGLVHNLDFRIVDQQVQFKTSRNERSTGQIRRHMPNALTAR